MTDLGKELQFECKRGALLAIYANATESRRFWVAESAGPIQQSERKDRTYPIFYYASSNSDYTEFKPEGGVKKVVKVKYSQCLCPIRAISRKNDVVVITPLVRDRITALGKKLDEESGSDNSDDEQN